MTRVDAEQTALIVVEVEEVEADATIPDRGNLELGVAMGREMESMCTGPCRNFILRPTPMSLPSRLH
jgi:hypothetical protein